MFGFLILPRVFYTSRRKTTTRSFPYVSFPYVSWPANAGHPYVDGPLSCKSRDRGSDRIACAHMCGLFVRSHMTAGQDGFRDASSKQLNGIEYRWVARSVSRLRIDRSHHLLLLMQVPASARGDRSPHAESVYAASGVGRRDCV